MEPIFFFALARIAVAHQARDLAFAARRMKKIRLSGATIRGSVEMSSF